jgi:hypothetical protein
MHRSVTVATPPARPSSERLGAAVEEYLEVERRYLSSVLRAVEAGATADPDVHAHLLDLRDERELAHATTRWALREAGWECA